MQLNVITPDGIKFLHELKVGDHVWCDSQNYLPIKSIVVVVEQATQIRLSTGESYHFSTRARVLTSIGFKFPELYDEIPISPKLIPQVIRSAITTQLCFLYDILIDGNMVSPEGITFKFGD